MKTTGIVILNYNNYSDTINCIKSVYKYCPAQNLIITVVDNGSANDSIAQISSFLNQGKYAFQIIDSGKGESQLSNFYIIPTNKNLGYAKGNNVGIKFLMKQKVENIVILNNDILFTSDIITPLTNCLANHPEIGLISPLLLKDEKNIDYNCCRNNPTYKMFLYESLQFLKLPRTKKIIDKKYILKTNPNLLKQNLVYCDIISGACIMAKTATWQKLSGFDPNTFLYYEENILFEKLKKIGLKSAIMTSINALHLGARATKKITNTKILTIELNSLLYYLKNYRKLTAIEIKIIQCIKLFQIYLLKINNKLRKK